MRWMRRAPIVASCAVLLLLPGTAAAVVLAPPGHAGANQYVEVIPTASGNAAPPGTVSGSGSATAGPGALARLGKGRVGDARLAQLGKDGRAAAALAASTAPSPVHGTARNGLAGANQPGSAPSGIVAALTGSDAGGLGVLLPLLLVTLLVAALAIAAAVFRRRAEPTAPGT